MKDALIDKFRGQRPLSFSEAEREHLREALRRAVGVALGKEPEAIPDEARLFDELGLDSIDVFDVLDQLGEEFEAQVALDELPNDLLHGREGLTFRDFADALLAYFQAPPAGPPQS